MDKVSLIDFYQMLEWHDWFYSYSDDHRVWLNGQENAGKLAEIAKQSEEHNKLFRDYSKHVFSGPSWNTEKSPKPEKPNG